MLYFEDNTIQTKQDSNIKKSYAEILKNAKPKGMVKVINTESHQKSPKRVTSIKVGAFQVEDMNITKNRKLRKKSKHKATEKSVAQENEVEEMNDLDLTSIFSSFLKDERNVTARNPVSPPNLIVDSSSSLNHSDTKVLDKEAALLTSQDKGLLSVLESIQNMNDSLNSRNQVSAASEGRLSGYFCSDTVFNLRRKILTDTEIKILEKGLDFASVQRKLKEPELRSDFQEFFRRVRTKWHLWNEPTPDFSNVPYVKSKSEWSPQGSSCY